MNARRQFLNMAAVLPVAAQASIRRAGGLRHAGSSAGPAPRKGELSILLGAGLDAVFHIGEYEIHLWKEREGSGWRAMVAWFGDGIELAEAEAEGATPAEALWNVSAPDGDSAPYAGDFAELPARLAAFTDAAEGAAVARAEAEDREELLED